MKMKKDISILVIVIFFGSCTKDLNPVDYTDLNPSIFPQSEADVEAMVYACYYPLRGSWWDGLNSTSERGIYVRARCSTEILSGKFSVQEYGHLLNYGPEDEDITYFMMGMLQHKGIRILQ
jgi:hypothetical protein